MFTKILLIILALFSCSSSAFADNEILVIQSARIAPYEAACKGFKSIIRTGIKQYVFSENPGTDIKKVIKENYPPLILAIGRDALNKIKDIKDVPVVFVMVLNPQTMLTRNDNFYGIYMNVSPELQLDIFKKNMPDLKKIGLIYNPNNSAYFIDKALSVSYRMGMALHTEKTYNANEVPAAIEKLSDKIDAFWMIPDRILMTPEAIDLMLITSIEKKIPIFSFSEKYIEVGALLSVAVNPYDMGKQAAEKAQKIIDGTDNTDEKIIFARKEVFSINKKIARKLGIELNK